MVIPLGAKYFLKKNTLNLIEDLPEKTISELRVSIATNWDDIGGFREAMAESGLSTSRLDLIFDNETHQADELAGMAEAGNLGGATKTWEATYGCCSDCQDMNGEEVPIDEPFSNGCMVAHGHPHCNCQTSYQDENGADLEQGKY